MAALAGFGGKFSVGANAITTVKDWELDISADLYETTTIQNVRAKTYIEGLYGWSGTLKFNWDASDANGLIVLQNQILNASPSSQAVTLSTNNGTNNYTGSILVKDLKVHDPVNNVIEADVSFTGTGALSFS